MSGQLERARLSAGACQDDRGLVRSSAPLKSDTSCVTAARTAWTGTDGFSSTATRTIRDVALLCAACMLSERLAFALRLEPAKFATVWFPGGIVLAALLLTAPRLWWGQVVGASVGLF